MRLGGRAHRHDRDLRRRIDPQRQHGDPHAAPDVEPTVVLHEPAAFVAELAVMDRRAPGDADLPAVRVTRQRQVHVRGGRFEEEVGMMAQQHRRFAVPAAGEGHRDVRPALRQIVDTREPQRRAVMLDPLPAIQQHRDAIVLEERGPQPDVGAPEVIVVAGHGEHPVARRQLGERIAKEQQFALTRVDEVAAEQHEVRFGRGDAAADRDQVAAVHEAARMNVGHERDLETRELRRSHDRQIELGHLERPSDPVVQPMRHRQQVEGAVHGRARAREQPAQRRAFAGQRADRCRRLRVLVRHAGELSARS